MRHHVSPQSLLFISDQQIVRGKGGNAGRMDDISSYARVVLVQTIPYDSRYVFSRCTILP